MIDALGCVLIGETKESPKGVADRLRDAGILTTWVCAPKDETAMNRLRSVYRETCDACRSTALMAEGCGCLAAMALAIQLSVERMVLIDPADRCEPPAPWIGRTRRFVRGNLALCAADTLLLCASWNALPRGWGSLPGTRVIRAARQPGMGFDKTDERLVDAIICFLRTGVLPKSLAENDEMCIINE